MQRRREEGGKEGGGVGGVHRGLSQISQEGGCLFDSVSHQHKHDDSSPQLEHRWRRSGASCSSAGRSDIILGSTAA